MIFIESSPYPRPALYPLQSTFHHGEDDGSGEGHRSIATTISLRISDLL